MIIIVILVVVFVVVGGGGGGGKETCCHYFFISLEIVLFSRFSLLIREKNCFIVMIWLCSVGVLLLFLSFFFNSRFFFSFHLPPLD